MLQPGGGKLRAFQRAEEFPDRGTNELQFRSEMFNVFNHVNFRNPDTTETDGTFGQILGANDGRIIQFALKLLW